MDCNAVANILSTIISRSVSFFSGKQSDKLIVALRRAFLLNLPAQRPIFAKTGSLNEGGNIEIPAIIPKRNHVDQ